MHFMLSISKIRTRSLPGANECVACFYGPSAKTAKTSSYLVMQPQPAFHEVKNEKGLKVASEHGGRMQG